VIADEHSLKRLVAECPELLAVAMEGAGVAVAVEEQTGTNFIEIRGISDFADSNKNDDWQEYAANAAAAFLMAWVSSGGLPLKSVNSVESEKPSIQQNAYFKGKLYFSPILKPSYFIGRDDLLADIHEKLQQDEPVLLVNGLGGLVRRRYRSMLININIVISISLWCLLVGICGKV